MKKMTAILALLGLIISCGGQSPTENARVTSGGKTLEAPKTVKTDVKAGKLLTAAMIARAFEIEEDLVQPTAAGQKDDQCSYVWPKPNKAEIEEANQNAIMDNMKKMMEAQRKGEKPPKLNVISGDATVFFNFKAMKESAQAESAFQSNVQNLKEGITVEKGGHKTTFRIDYDQVIDGLGRQAAWSNGSRQLFVQHDRYLLYLNVDTQEKPDDELPYAKTMMAEILKKM